MALGPWFLLALWGLVLVGLSALARRLLARVFRRSFEYIVLPGTLAHELSHAVGCLVTGARITRFALLDRDGGYVAHTQPKLPVIGQVVISLAPILGCGTLLVICALQLDLIGWSTRLPAEAILSGRGMGEFIGGIFDAHASVLKRFGRLDLAAPMTYIWAYLAFCMAAMLGPSRQDLKNAALGVLALVLTLWLIAMGLDAAGVGSGGLAKLPRTIWRPLTVCVALAGLAAVCALLLRVAHEALAAVRSTGESSAGQD